MIEKLDLKATLNGRKDTPGKIAAFSTYFIQEKLNEVIEIVNKLDLMVFGPQISDVETQCSCNDKTIDGCPVHGLKY